MSMFLNLEKQGLSTKDRRGQLTRRRSMVIENRYCFGGLLLVDYCFCGSYERRRLTFFSFANRILFATINCLFMSPLCHLWPSFKHDLPSAYAYITLASTKSSLIKPSKKQLHFRLTNHATKELAKCNVCFTFHDSELFPFRFVIRAFVCWLLDIPWTWPCWASCFSRSFLWEFFVNFKINFHVSLPNFIG